MYLGQRLLVKHNGTVQEGNIEHIYFEDVDVRLLSGELLRRKFWEVRKIDGK
jgi:hypothetical protein